MRRGAGYLCSMGRGQRQQVAAAKPRGQAKSPSAAQRLAVCTRELEAKQARSDLLHETRSSIEIVFHQLERVTLSRRRSPRQPARYRIKDVDCYDLALKGLEEVIGQLDPSLVQPAQVLHDRLAAIEPMRNSTTIGSRVREQVEEMERIGNELRDQLIHPISQEQDELKSEISELDANHQRLASLASEELIRQHLVGQPLLRQAISDLSLAAQDIEQRSDLELLFGGGRVGQAAELLSGAAREAPEGETSQAAAALVTELDDLGQRLPWRQEMGADERERAAAAALRLAALGGLLEEQPKLDAHRSSEGVGLLFGPRRSRRNGHRPEVSALLDQSLSADEALEQLGRYGLLEEPEIDK